MIVTGQDLAQARRTLGLSQYELADKLRLGGSTENGAKYVREVESGKRALTGPMAVAVEQMLERKDAL